MPSTQTDRIDGLTTSVAVKAPAVVATTANITLSGLQVIDTVTVTTGDRVLVWQQTDGVENAIYEANTSSWVRAADFNGARDAVQGTSVRVAQGATYAKTEFTLRTVNPTIGSDALTFEVVERDAIGDIIIVDTEITVGAAGDYTTMQLAQDWLEARRISPSATVTVTVLGEVLTVAGDILNSSHPDSSRIQYRGQTPISTTLTDIVSVTGSAGAWSVTGTLADATGIGVGDVLRVEDVQPGVALPGAYAGRPVAGAMHLGFFQMGALTTSGTSATITDDGTTYMADGDLVFVQGQVRKISSLAASSFTLSSAFAGDIGAVQYWFHHRPGTGTVAISGTAVTGTGTAFLTEYNVGDLIFADGAACVVVSAIADDTNMTLAESMTVGSGAAHGPLTLGEYHEGGWEVTAVSGNDVTWTHTGQSAYAPPIQNITSGNIKALTSVLKTTGGDGFTVDRGSLDINNLAIVGGTGTATIGLDCRGDGNRFAGEISLGSATAVLGFGYGAWSASGCMLYAKDGMFTGASYRGLNVTEGGQAWLEGAAINGNVGIGVLCGTGAYTRLSATRMMGNSTQGYRSEVGGSCWMDFGHVTKNGADGCYIVGAALVHLIGTRMIGNAGGGVNASNGCYGRATGLISLGNAATGVSFTQSFMECNQTNLVGNGSRGASVTRCMVSFEESGSSFNGSDGYYSSLGATINATAAQSVDNVATGFKAVTGGLIQAVSSVSTGNATQHDPDIDTDPASGSRVSVSPSTTLITPKALYLTEVFDVGSCAANATTTQARTFTGALISDCLAWSCNSTIPAGVSVVVHITGTNTLTISVTNHTAGAISFGNRTWTYMALRLDGS